MRSETTIVVHPRIDRLQDAGGGLNAAWITNTGSDPVSFRTSADGRDWSPIKTLEPATNDGAFNLRVGAASDGGGWVVWDGNNTGPIKLAPIPPRGPAGADGGEGGAAGWGRGSRDWISIASP